MISKETAIRIYTCYREIEVGEKLLANIEKALARDEDPNPRDPFGRRRPFSFGVPMGNDGERMFDVPARLSVSVIKASIAEKKRELVEANEQARIESTAAGDPPRMRAVVDELGNQIGIKQVNSTQLVTGKF